MITEFTEALNQEITAIKSGRGGSVVGVYGGRFIERRSALYIYTFSLDNFLASIDDSPIELKIDDKTYKGHVIQTQGLQITIGISEDLGPEIDHAQLITNLYFLLEMLKGKYEKAADRDFSFSRQIFEGSTGKTNHDIDIPVLEKGRFIPNEAQMEAIRLSQRIPNMIIWGPPGTGKTETLARVAECFAKRGKKVLVVAHANAAVDECVEDIAGILKETSFYEEGQIVRLGNYQKQSLSITCPMVLIENIVAKKGGELQATIYDLNNSISEIKKSLSNINKVQSTQAELNKLSELIEEMKTKSTSLEEEKSSQGNKITKSDIEIKAIEKDLAEVNNAGRLKRALSRKNPEELKATLVVAKDKSQGFADRIIQIGIEWNDIQLKIKEHENSKNEKAEEVAQHRLSLGLSEADLSAEKITLNQNLASLKTKMEAVQNELNELSKKVVVEARIICTTITKTFSDTIIDPIQFDALIVDESSMAPMPYLFWAISKCREAVVIVGDFLQLPPICISKDEMAQKWFNRSIFDHLEINEVDAAFDSEKVRLLDTQYRMHPSISEIPNRYFYKERLLNGQSTLSINANDQISNTALNIIDTSETKPWCSKLERGSRFNMYSAVLAVNIARRLLEDQIQAEGSVGIISPYAPQARLIGNLLKELGLDEKVRVATVHRFQGGEIDKLIFDTTEGQGVRISGFIDDLKRDSQARLLINVALTRAIRKLYIIGDLSYLYDNLSKGAVLFSILKDFETDGTVIDSDTFVDSYFARDFDKAVAMLHGAPIDIEITGDSYYDQGNFYPAFINDIQNAKKEVIIASPFVTESRTAKLADLFRALVNRGISLQIYIRPPSDLPHSDSSAIDALKKMGAKVVHDNQKAKLPGGSQMHQKFAVIDEAITWTGSLNILSHNDTGEMMYRITQTAAANQLRQLCGLGSNNDAIDSKSEPILTEQVCAECGGLYELHMDKRSPYLQCSNTKCRFKEKLGASFKVIVKITCEKPGCGAKMVLRNGKYGPFLGCSRYPDCRSIKNIM